MKASTSSFTTAQRCTTPSLRPLSSVCFQEILSSGLFFTSLSAPIFIICWNHFLNSIFWDTPKLSPLFISIYTYPQLPLLSPSVHRWLPAYLQLLPLPSAYLTGTYKCRRFISNTALPKPISTFFPKHLHPLPVSPILKWLHYSLSLFVPKLRDHPLFFSIITTLNPLASWIDFSFKSYPDNKHIQQLCHHPGQVTVLSHIGYCGRLPTLAFIHNPCCRFYTQQPE